MQQVPLLQTKLYVPPRRAELVPRPRLIERLNAGLDRKLTVISAPAGFGKTTLVGEWLHKVGAHGHAPLHVAWLSLDEADNDLSRFLAYLIAALQTVEAGIGKGTLSTLQSPQPPPAEVVLTPLLNEMAALPDRILLVLDDYHLIETQAIHDALTFLLEHLPPPPGGLHLVIATREDPLLPLARLRARGQLTELRATDLRFTSAEAAEFLNQVMGLDLAARDVAVLERRTEGWIAGLQLASLALQGTVALQGSSQGRQDASSLIQSFTGSHRHVLDYLIEEVLGQQPESVQTFLLQTAILDRLTGPLCDAVRFGRAETPSSSTGTALQLGRVETPADRDNGQATLELLDRANLFIVPLDGERRWYRYHHLFADLLRQRLGQTQPEWLPTLHLRASRWYEQNGFADEAIDHALRSEVFEQAAGLLEDHADAMWTRSEHIKLRRWLAKLPEEMIRQRPLLCVFHGWFLYTRGPREEAEQYLQIAEQGLDSSTGPAVETSLPEQATPADSEGQALRGRAAVIRALMASYQGDVPAIIEHGHQALETLPRHDLNWRSTAAIALGDTHGFKGDMVAAYEARLEAAEASAAAGNTIFSILAYIKVAITLREQGRLQRTIELCQQQLQQADEGGLPQGSAAGGVLAVWGEVLAELGDLEGALARVQKGMEYAERGGDWSLFGWSCMCALRVLFSAGDMDGVQAIVHKVKDRARKSGLPPWVMGQMAAWQARLWLVQGKLEEAAQWGAGRGLLAGGEPQLLPDIDYFLLIEYLVVARILIAQERLDEAGRLLAHLLQAAEAGDRTTRVIEVLLLQALAWAAGGEPTQAMAPLERALALAQPEGFVGIFADEGPPLAQLLYKAANRGIAPDYVRRLLAAFPAAEAERPEPSESSVPGSELIEPLSEREIEVLQLVAEGLTNREIATRLYLALNTIKAHTRNIYGKLGVGNRTQAVARARALGILPSA
ncbi:MAG: LuxR C-terminal-related transcriptional regulator [Anaerolineae bacterium]